MPEALYGFAILACPLSMGIMMWIMMRGDKRLTTPQQPTASDTDTELARLRAAVDQLQSARPGAAHSVPHRAQR